MAQQDTTQAQAASATTTEGGSTLFTHLAKAPKVHETNQDIRHFNGPMSCIRINRFENQNVVRANIDVYSADLQSSTSTSTALSADQCESIARALIDAAHDLRTHSANQLMVNTIVEMTEGGAV